MTASVDDAPDRPDLLLRERAESALRRREALVPPPVGADPMRMIHELQVHQIELEMQYEELLAARAESEQERARFVDLYNHAPIGYLTLLPDGTILRANQASSILLGETRDTLPGQSFLLHVGPVDRRRLLRWLCEVFDESGDGPCELALAGDAPTARVVRLEAVLGPDRTDCRVALLDVTEHRRLESALRQSQRMESVGRLAGGIAHDFNNLLTVINGYAEVLQESLAADSELADVAREIGQAGARAATITGQLLSFSRRQPLEVRALDVNTVVLDIGPLIGRLLGPEFDLQLVVHREAVMATIDAGQFGQVLMNLALNARDAMPHGGTIAIHTGVLRLSGPIRRSAMEVEAPHVAAESDIPAGGYALVTVTDTGTGMVAATAEHLFEPFVTTKEVGKGTGLGLALVYGIMQQFGGYIIVESALGRGSAFMLYLPLANAPPVESARAFALTGATPRRAGRKETILLVEDERAVRALTRRLLEADGYTVLEAASGEEALQLAAGDTPIDLLLTDVRMPGIDGQTLAGRLRATRAHLPVLFMSGYAGPSEVVIPDEHGALPNPRDAAARLVHKPFTEATLARMVREVLDRG